MTLLSKRNIYVLLVSLVTLSAFFIWSFLIEPNRLVVKNYQLKMKSWSPKLNGFKIAVISDVHGGSNFINEEKIKEIVRLTNAQQPDVILLLGDYVSRQTFKRSELRMPLKTAIESLRGLQAESGVYAVIGNQDNFLGNEVVRKEVENLGYTVLEFEAVKIEKNSEKIYLVGLADSLRSASDIFSREVKRALAKINKGEGKVILFGHNPDVVWTVTEKLSPSEDVVLFIGGHTHGGQWKFPIIGAPFVPTIYGQKYAQGHIRDKGIDIFISSGIGTSLIPSRFGVPPEISILEISQEN